MARLRGWLSGAWDLVGADLPIFSLAAFLTIAGTLLSAWILAVPLTVGLCVMFLEKLQGRKPTLAHLAEGFSRFPAAVFVWGVYVVGLLPFGLIHAGINAAVGERAHWGLLAEAIGHLIIATPLLLVAPLIAHRELGGIEAVRTSWRLVRTQLPLAFVTMTVVSVLLVVGLFACGLGVILTVPVTVGTLVLAYRDLAGVSPATTASDTNEASEVHEDAASDADSSPADRAGAADDGAGG